jgi:hypothetical protein
MNISKSNSVATNPAPADDNKQIVLKEIAGKWSKLSEQDVSALKGKDDLIAQVAAKYSLEKAKAQKDVEVFLKGRQF